MIGHQLFQQIGRTQSVTQTAPVPASQEAALARGAEKLSHLSDGQTVQGKLLSVSENADGSRMAQVDLGDGAVVNAKLSGNMALTPGQDISFSVKNAAGASVTLRPLYANMTADPSSLKALSQAGLPASPDMTAMVKEMMSEGMPIDRSSLLSMTRGVMTYPGHATSVVQMTNLGIPVTEENLQQFENYRNFEHQVMGSIGEIMDELPDAFHAMNESGNNKGALDLYGELLNLFGSEGEEAAAAATGEQTATVFSEEALLAGEGEAVTEKTAQNPEGAGRLSFIPEGDQAGSEVQRGAVTENNREANAQSAASAEGGRAGDALEAAMKALSEAKAQGGDVEIVAPGARAHAPQNDAFTQLLRELKLPEQVIQSFQSGNAENSAQTELLRSLADAWRKTAHTDEKTDAAWTRLFASREMGGLLKNAIEKDWLLKPGDVGEKNNVRALYDRLQSQTRELSQILSRAGGTQTALSQSVNNLQSNLNFMNDLNHMFQYVQLPLKMSGQDAHGDLYVYSNKKGKLSEDGTVSAILHLDMDNLGPTDVYVKMRDNNVKTNFYLADDEVIDLIMEHIDELNRRLEKRGYSMETKLQLQDEMGQNEDAPVKEMLTGNLGHISLLSHTSFDALA